MLTLSFLFLTLFAAAFGAEWTHTGADTWGKSFDHCNGKKQSPIAIDHHKTLFASMGPFEFKNYDKSNVSMSLTNNGHAVQVNFKAEDDITMNGGGLPGKDYHLAQMHFHWGSVDNQGSEHTLNGIAYDAELHFVHHDKVHADLGSAADKEEGLAVLGVFLKVGQYDNPYYAKVIDYFKDVMYKGATKTIPGFELSSLLPSDKYFFYRYNGGLTTPPCFQSVVWTVFRQPIYISHEQMKAFRMLKENAQGDGSDRKLHNNYRPVQPIGDREVYVSVFKTSSATMITSTITFVSIIITKVLSLVFTH